MYTLPRFPAVSVLTDGRVLLVLTGPRPTGPMDLSKGASMTRTGF